MRQAIRKANDDSDGAVGIGVARDGAELPLFGRPAAAAPTHARTAGQGRRALPRRTQRSPQAEHREAAWRLARAIRRAPGAAAQARIGGLVCGHLRAMLREAGEDTDHQAVP